MEPLNALIIEDNDDDLALLLRALRQGGFEPNHQLVRKSSELAQALEKSWDIVLSDYRLPHLSGVEALKQVKERQPELPFIMVSGTIGEDIAVEMMRAGANDYVMKGQLGRLPEAIRREKREAQLREEQQRTEQALRHSEERFRMVTELANDAILGIDPGGRVIMWNQSASRIFGYAQKDILGQPLQLLIPEKLRPVYQQAFKVALEQSHPPPHGLTLQFTGLHRDGHTFPVEVWVTHWTNELGTHYTGIVRDIQDRKSAELERARLLEQLRQAQKMEAIGRLAGGVAHDFNNMLSVILGYADLAKTHTEPSSPIWSPLEEIAKAAKRSESLTRQLLAFARKQAISPKPLDLNDVVRSNQPMLSRLIGENVRIELALDPALWKVKIDPQQFENVLVNLGVNARDAILNVGTITIKTFNVLPGSSWHLTYPRLGSETYVGLSFCDTGNGMSEETLQHIFEPFFTTKDSSKGTGLGLATIYGIVKQNQGFIQVQSQVGQGTDFHIFFPRYHGPVEEAVPFAETQPRRGNESILLVEDEPQILELLEAYLTQLGYRVASESNPEKAVERVHRAPHGFDLLLTDVIMPGMDGKQLYDEVRRIQPGIKVLFMSGYTAEAFEKQMISDRKIFLQKPFNMVDLTRKIREILS
ncbi:MAG: response regulator [Acidobacteria bacterium]|nr:response regulator [Acidobacteriota bacterium]MCB9398845.1 response regulator [Acidobacteriota bacterium]